jgi:hypothetical protein
MSKHRLEHRQGDRVEDAADNKPDTLQRVEIITGIGWRRRLSQVTKAPIVLENRAPAAVVSEVAGGTVYPRSSCLDGAGNCATL